MPTVLFIVAIPGEIDDANGQRVDVLRMVKQTLTPLTSAVVTVTEDVNKDNGYQLTFQADQDLNAEAIISALESIGVGHEFGSISMTDLTFGLPEGVAPEFEEDSDLKASVTSRLVIHQLLEETESASAFSFDYVLLCIMGSIIATLGLAIASPAIIVASMLVSPILGPILATAFGTVLCDWKLFRKGLEVELAGLLLCVATGFVTGICLAPWGYWLQFPTVEMTSRGEPYSGLIIGAFIALPSGVGVGLSVLGNNMPALIGVAISASLLPPAANCGLFMAYGIFGEMFHGNPVASQEMYQMGIVSLLITLLNILCIYIASILIFRIKEVVPLPDKTDLWKTFIPEVRRQNLSQIHDERLERMIQTESAQFHHRSSSIFGNVLAAQRPARSANYDSMVGAARLASGRVLSQLRSRHTRASQFVKIDSDAAAK